MRFHSRAVAATAATAISLCASVIDSFTTPPPPPVGLSSVATISTGKQTRSGPSTFSSSLGAFHDDNGVPSDVEEKEGREKSAISIRNAVVSNVRNEEIALGETMGTEKEDRTSVVVFLRHMGWPYCWSYANEWSERKDELNLGNVNGPIFVSVGDPTKLRAFLDENPGVDEELAFVDTDSENFEAYEAAGFDKKFTDVSPEEAKQVKMKAPGLSFGQWISYARSVGKTSPIPKDANFFSGKVPEGVLRLGGTFVIKGNNVVYRWNDRLPGDHPDIQEVLSVALSAASAA